MNKETKKHIRRTIVGFLIIASLGTACVSVYKADDLRKDLAKSDHDKVIMQKDFNNDIKDLKARIAANDNKINQAAKDADKAVKDNSKQDKDIIELKK